jgi:tyrosyl-tRNA synthetase
MFQTNDKLEILKTLTNEELEIFSNAMGGFKYENENLFETIVKANLENSNSNSRNAVKSGAIYVNEEKIEDFNFDISSSFINNKFLFIRK